MKIGLLSDTHSFLDVKIFEYFEHVDEIWHAGDIGNIEVADQLESFKTFRAVFGNIDGGELRIRYPEDQIFEVEGVSVWMTHIGGYPPRYNSRTIGRIKSINPKSAIRKFTAGRIHKCHIYNQ